MSKTDGTFFQMFSSGREFLIIGRELETVYEKIDAGKTEQPHISVRLFDFASSYELLRIESALDSNGDNTFVLGDEKRGYFACGEIVIGGEVFVAAAQAESYEMAQHLILPADESEIGPEIYEIFTYISRMRHGAVTENGLTDVCEAARVIAADIARDFVDIRVYSDIGESRVVTDMSYANIVRIFLLMASLTSELSVGRELGICTDREALVFKFDIDSSRMDSIGTFEKIKAAKFIAAQSGAALDLEINEGDAAVRLRFAPVPDMDVDFKSRYQFMLHNAVYASALARIRSLDAEK